MQIVLFILVIIFMISNIHKKFNKKSFNIWIIGVIIITLITIILESIQIINLEDSTGYFPIYILMSIPIYLIYTLWIYDYNKKQ